MAAPDAAVPAPAVIHGGAKARPGRPVLPGGPADRGDAAAGEATALADRAGRAAAVAGGHPLHARILARLGPSPLAEDQLIRDLELPAAQVAPELLALELDGVIERQTGGLIVRVG
jgi:DNA processing protein